MWFDTVGGRKCISPVKKLSAVMLVMVIRLEPLARPSLCYAVMVIRLESLARPSLCYAGDGD